MTTVVTANECPTTVGTPYSLSSLTNKWFKPALMSAGLSTEFRLYDLRHTHATMLLARGVPVKVVSERLGHSSIVITLDTYMHVLPHMQAWAAVSIEQALWPLNPLGLGPQLFPAVATI